MKKSASERMSILPVGGFSQNRESKTARSLLCTELFTNPLRLPYNDDQLGLMVPYNGDRLGFTFSKDNYHNDFMVTEITSFKCLYRTIEPLNVVIVRNTAVKMLIADGNYESRSRLP